VVGGLWGKAVSLGLGLAWGQHPAFQSEKALAGKGKEAGVGG
jgi:hypothetical protein